MDDAVNLFLFDYPSTPHMTTGVSLAILMLNRELRTCFDLLKPDVRSHVEKKKQSEQREGVKGKRNCTLEAGETIFAKDPRTSVSKRSKAVVVGQNSPSTYTVKFRDNFVSKRHGNQIVKSSRHDSFNEEGSADGSASGNRKNGCVSEVCLPRRSNR